MLPWRTTTVTRSPQGHTLTVSNPTLGLLGNDTDADEDTLTIASHTSPNGSLALSSNGTFTYTPSSGYTGTDSFVYTVSDGALTASATVTIDVTSEDMVSGAGVPFAAVQGQAFSGTVASVTDDNPDVTATDLSATIIWGDGGTSSGTVSSGVDGAFVVSGTHTYAEQGPYVLAVQVTDDLGGTSGAALDYGLVMPLDQDTQLQTVVSDSLTYSGSGTQTGTDSSGTFSLAESGTLDFSLQSTVQGVGTSETTSTSEELYFSITGSSTTTGTGSSSLVTLGSYSSSATGSDSVYVEEFDNTPGSNSVVSGTQTGSDAVTVTSSGDQSTGAFSWTRTQTGTLLPDLQGFTPSGSYLETGTVSHSVSVTESGNFASDTFSWSETDIATPATAQTGNNGAESYIASTTGSDYSSLTESGTLGGAFTGTIGGTTVPRRRRRVRTLAGRIATRSRPATASPWA